MGVKSNNSELMHLPNNLFLRCPTSTGFLKMENNQIGHGARNKFPGHSFGNTSHAKTLNRFLIKSGGKVIRRLHSGECPPPVRGVMVIEPDKRFAHFTFKLIRVLFGNTFGMFAHCFYIDR